MSTTLNTTGGVDLNASAIVVGGGYAIIAVFGTIGNTLVLFLVATTDKLKNTSSVFIVNLAVTDLMTCMIFSLVVVSRFAEYRPYQETMCFITLSVAHTTVVVSVYTLASIAINRLILILSPMNYYLKIFRAKTFAVWITIIWFLAIMLAVFPAVVLDIGRLGYSKRFMICRTDEEHEKSDLYDAILIFAVFPPSFSIVIVSYIFIYAKVLIHNKRMQKSNKTTIALSTSSTGEKVSEDDATGKMTGESDKGRFALQMRVTKNMFIIFLAFLLCGTPHAICNFTECPLEAYTRLIVSTNSLLNPIIYGIGHPHFREAFIKLLKRK